MRKARGAALVAIAVIAALVTTGAPSNAANPGTPGPVAFVRGGNIFVAPNAGAAAVQATTGGNYLWPKWSPDGFDELAYLFKGDLYIGFFDENGQLYNERRLTTGGHVGAPSWSPDGNEIAYIQTLTYPTLTIAHLASSQLSVQASAIKASGVATRADIRSATSVLVRRVGPKVVTPAVAGSWSSLQDATGVAWSPNGEGIAFPGGECLGISDTCLSVLDLATNVERTVAAFSGGGNPIVGYATTPAWTADSSKLLWTQQTSGPANDDPIGPKQVWESDSYDFTQTQVGGDGDSIPSPSPAANGAVIFTSDHNSTQWISKIGATHFRTWLYQGYQADWGVALI